MNRRHIALALLLPGLGAGAACQAQKPAPATQAGPATVASGSPAGAAALPPGHPPVSTAAGAATPDPSKAISGEIVLAPALASKVGAHPALFIIARDPASQQIVAVRKEEVASFPFSFTISEADWMTQGDAKFGEALDLTARVSKSGDAMPASGDVEGLAKGVTVGARNARITLDTLRP